MATIPMAGYQVHLAAGLLGEVGAIARRAAPAHRYAIITDATVGPLYAERVARSFGDDRPVVFSVAAGEEHKNRDSWAHLTDAMLAAGCGRDTTVVALGGGVVGDLAGFVAATYMRGVPCVLVPTTLLAMIDASIGGKTGVDTPAGKNLVGAFHRPAAVVADPDALRTLPPPLVRAGLAEAIKHGAIADADYFDRIERWLPAVARDVTSPDMLRLIARSIELKGGIVGADEHEGGRRRILNFGHTLGHAIEAASGFGLLHGEAVAIGMVLESAVAERVGAAASGTGRRIAAVVARAGLPVRRPTGLQPRRILEATRTDKKALGGTVRYALPERVGAMAGGGSGWSIPVP